MIKTTNGEAAKLLSPAISILMTQSDRPFPLIDGFKLEKNLDDCRNFMKVYQEKTRKLVDDNKGEIKTYPNGLAIIKYPTDEIKEKAEAEQKTLDSIKIKLPISKLKAREDWPNLTMPEIGILKLIVDFSDLK